MIVVFAFVYFGTTLTGLILLADGIETYIRYKKNNSTNGQTPRFKAKMTSAKKQSRTALILLVFGPFFLLFLGLKAIIHSLPKRPASLRIFWDAVKDIFFTF